MQAFAIQVRISEVLFSLNPSCRDELLDSYRPHTREISVS